MNNKLEYKKMILLIEIITISPSLLTTTSIRYFYLWYTNGDITFGHNVILNPNGV